MTGRLRAFAAADWIGLLAVIVAGCLGLAAFAASFSQEYNVYVILRNASVNCLVALAQMMTLAVGQMNLAVGAIGGLSAIAIGGMTEVWQVPLAAAVPLVLLLGALCGLINGALTVGTGINGFIITLATASAFTGINFGITESIPFYHPAAGLVVFGQGRWGAIPHILVVPVAAALLLALVLARTVPGRQMLAVGGNLNAAQFSGISSARAIVTAHVLSGLLAAMAAILAVARLGSAQPTIGQDWLLLSFAAPIIGGAVLTGGAVSVVGTTLAVLLIALIENGMVLTQVDPYWVEFVLGALILGAVGLNRWRAVRAAAG